MRGYEKWLTPEMIARQVPLNTLSDNGVLLLGSSDSPVQSVDPFLQMRGMREFYVEEESLSAWEALKTYTVNAGPMLGEKIGLLMEGYEAGFFTIGCDLLSIPPEALDGLKAEGLWLDGKKYRPLRGGVGTLIKLALSRPKKI
jgi:predicted amidohydrolase YtcJ